MKTLAGDGSGSSVMQGRIHYYSDLLTLKRRKRPGANLNQPAHIYESYDVHLLRDTKIFHFITVFVVATHFRWFEV